MLSGLDHLPVAVEAGDDLLQLRPDLAQGALDQRHDRRSSGPSSKGYEGQRPEHTLSQNGQGGAFH
eukprot:7674781-Pyramimonas_sp.AAC.1